MPSLERIILLNLVTNQSFVLGKTCKDVCKHRDIRLVRDEEKAKKLVARPQYLQNVEYNEDFAAIQLRKTVVKLDKPRYCYYIHFFSSRFIGMAILDISKLIMYEFHYDFIMEKYPGSKLLFTDTG